MGVEDSGWSTAAGKKGSKQAGGGNGNELFFFCYKLYFVYPLYSLNDFYISQYVWEKFEKGAVASLAYNMTVSLQKRNADEISSNVWHITWWVCSA